MIDEIHQKKTSLSYMQSKNKKKIGDNDLHRLTIFHE